jgi:adenylate kinase
MIHVILMGPQGSGKGTQSERVREQLHLASVATGELFRAAIKSDSSLGQQIKAIYDRGELVPDDVTVALVAERLDELARAGREGGQVIGALYDGYPRTSAQAQALDTLLAQRGEKIDAVIAIDVPRAELIQRLSGRRLCSVCGKVYNVVSDPPARLGECDACGGALIQRADDTPDAVSKRLDLYERETAPLLDRYAERGVLISINGDRPIDEVTDAIVSAIREQVLADSPAR